MQKMYMILLEQFMHKNVHSSSHPYRLDAMPFVDLVEILVLTDDPLTGLVACRLVGLTVLWKWLGHWHWLLKNDLSDQDEFISLSLSAATSAAVDLSVCLGLIKFLFLL